jgi:flagellar biosynthetic protein FliR
MAGVIDPLNGTNENAIGGLLQTTFVIFFIISNGHLLLLKLLGRSFEVIPPQLIWLKKDVLIDIISMGKLLFEWAIKLAAPTVAAALILDSALGLMSRMAPDFDILFLSLPIRLFIGLALIGITIKFGAGFFEKMAEFTAAYAARIFTGLP